MDGSLLLGMAALITSISSAIVLLLGQMKNRQKVETVHQLVNSQLTRKMDRIVMLEGRLDKAGISYPSENSMELE